ncbi:paraquat-inducible protein A [Hirschia baltica]|uniref:Paraquat-inducible protein A n=1 Tax=Hirschia baltica (strain ATCC 49814 / DSM 5838 / IFAM 1418) TaxID=582402 RepID=C6XKI1_HIRBI|nr:paraquat-inducible protein A [Hirschia baltica]ACT57779.1 Paraquat-inducible protein A [Hirschia baltica ATCC 49814]
MNTLRSILAATFVLAAWPLLAAGYLLPLVKLTKLKFFTETPSLLSVIAGLSIEKDYFLASVFVIFTLFFPISKLALLTSLVFSPKRQYSSTTKWLARLGKWSMLDVMVLAIGVYAAHRSGFAAAASQPGAWCFTASILLSALAAEFIPTHIKKAADSQTDTAAPSID